MKNFNSRVISFLAIGVLFSSHVSAFSEKDNTLPNNHVIMNECAKEQINTERGVVEYFNVSQLVVIEIEEEIDLGFDSNLYLPENFNALEGMYVEVDDIVILEKDEELELGFKTDKYLPKGFNPYACARN